MMVRLLLASAMALGLASGQGRGGGSGGDGAGMAADSAMAGMPRAPRQSRAEIVADKLHLNKEQKAQAATIFSAAQEEATPINDEIRQGRNVITSALIEGKTSDDINKMMAQYTDLVAKKSTVEAKTYAKIYAILDAKQQVKSATVFAEQMDGMFDGGGRRGGNRGGR